MRCSKVRLLVVLAAAVFLIVAAGPGWSQMLWDHSRELSLDKNPNGPWTYGYLDQDGKFVPFNNTFEPTEGVVGWCMDDNPDAGGNVTVNVTDKPIERFGVVWEPGQVCIHPGQFGAKAVVRWTSPVAGTLSLDIGLSGRSELGPPARLEVRHQESTLTGSVIDGFAGVGSSKGGRFGPAPELVLQPIIKAVRDETVDIVVSDTGCGVTGHVALTLTVAAAGDRISESERAKWDWISGGLASSLAPLRPGNGSTGRGMEISIWHTLFTVGEKG